MIFLEQIRVRFRG